ncbi:MULTISPECIES: 5'-3' exonuclease H3TH domain-containing protein [unclassified Paenibacillus]|uniref:5'-3' exonuclease n=1 Tax=unclassified Paenibacillus TaxID=185978 RepID=UPI002405F18A|nr:MULTISPECIES: 5'-3' exonuclease H3TH domain-containing protein [unclassified Paenibacillus]MDF9844241.1 5'-3' exonuclease [Paenibacillus sp. PastF-2]MDF9850846.1 5'-3' exonuclease [Paenibacillus sp. PastM-2]MDF9857391.1 5'-3' exonuclease [Paenibacillus sp. PastF-1]MDH6482659.1 5'-3' exonuclease [Paenibacillus sp. PastH-2]MDH6510111.1 5'-3' exonuclease [Paenibacillus sp. PastM-3]
MSSETTGRVMIVDGMALLFRAFYATSYGGYIRKTKAGLPTNAVYGFLQYFFDAVSTFEPSHVVCCWDMGKGTFRTEKYDGYKSNRIDAPLELIPQFDLVKEVVAELGVPNIGLAGYEADDCIGTLAACYGGESEVYILTGDHDMLQLVTDNVKVVIMKKGRSNYKVYDPAELLEEKGLTPRQVIDLKGFMGDTSDNYPGVKGIGEKTALKLLTEYGSVEGVIENLEALPKGVRSKIEADLDMLHLSRELAEIRCDVPVVCTLAECLWELQRDTAARKFQELEFGSLMHLIGGIAEARDERGIVQIELGDLG